MAKWKIVAHTEIANQMMKLDLQVDPLFEYQPGQFVHLRVSDGFDYLLRRPISLCNYEPKTQILSLVYRISGDGTRALSKRAVGMDVDILGPLGHGFPVHDQDQHVLLIGGGIGVPPLLEFAKHVHHRGIKVTAIIGFQSKDVVILEKELQEFAEVLVCTDDGSYGYHGRVTDLMSDSLLTTVDRYYSCGPIPMLRAIVNKAESKLQGYISLEERMGCGVGACMACVQWTYDANGERVLQKICKQGPVFEGSEVVFE